MGRMGGCKETGVHQAGLHSEQAKSKKSLQRGNVWGPGAQYAPMCGPCVVACMQSVWPWANVPCLLWDHANVRRSAPHKGTMHQRERVALKTHARGREWHSKHMQGAESGTQNACKGQTRVTQECIEQQQQQVKEWASWNISCSIISSILCRFAL